MSVQKALILAIALLLVVSASATAASQRVNWTWSGAAIQNVALTEPGCRALLIEVDAKGSPGAAKIKGLNRNCSGVPRENSLVAVFKDGSLLNILSAGPPYEIGSLDCGDGVGGVYIDTPVYFNGGFGRFSNATGEARLKIHACPVGMVADGPSYLMWEYGTITGTLHR
jgi:hypothetical protein